MISVLYVDDEPELLDITKIFLERTHKFTVATCVSGPEAQKALNDRRYDAIVSDYQMPGMDGIDLLKFVRATYGSIPFILFTGRGREEVAIQALENGADFYLQKGGDPRAQFAELQNKIEKAVNEQRALSLQRETEKRLIDIINFLPDATFAIDAEGTVLVWNHAVEDMTGIPARDIIGKGDYEYALPFYAERRPILLDLILHYDTTAASRYDLIKREGNKLISEKFLPLLYGGKGAYLWFAASPLYNSEGKVVGAIESIRDITEKKKLEGSLLASEKRFHNVFDSAAEPMIVLDGESGKVLDVNTAAIRMYGYSREEFCGMTCGDLTVDGEWLVPRGRTGILERVVRDQKRKDGSLFPAEITGNIYPQKRRSIAIINIRDISERKEAEEELARRNEEMEELNSQLLARQEELKRQLKRITQTERALKASQDRLDRTFMAVSEGIWDWEIPGGKVYFSPSYYTMLGYKKDEFPATYDSWRSLVHPDDIVAVEEDVMDHIRRGDERFAIELRMRAQDGGWRWVLMRGSVVERTPDGLKTRIVGTDTDITDWKVAEEARARSETEYRTLFENMQEGVSYCRMLYDQEGKPCNWVFLAVNKSFERLTGLRDVTGKEAIEVIPGIKESNPELFDIYGEIVRTGRPQVFEIDFKPLGMWLTVSAFSATRDHFVAIFNDITARKRMEHDLEASEQQFRSLVDYDPDAIFIQTDQCFAYLNPAALRLFGASTQAEIVGQPVIERFHPMCREEITERIRVLNVERGNVPPLEEVVLRLDGGTVDVEVSAVPFVHEGKNGALVFARDITQQKELLRQLAVNEGKFRSLSMLMSDFAFSCVDQDGTGYVIDWMTGAVEEITGFSIEELNEMGCWRSIVMEEDLPLFDRHVTGLSPGEKGTCELRVKSKDGSPVWLLCRTTCVSEPDLPGCPRLIGGCRDITPRKTLEEDLKRERTLLRVLLDTQLTPLIILSLDGGVLFGNRAAFSLFDLPQTTDFSKFSVSDYVHPDSVDRVREDMRAIIEGGGPVVGEYHVFTATGEEMWVEGSGIRVTVRGTDADLVTLRDITSRRQMEHALQDANRKMNLLSQLTRHDVANKLSTLNGYIEISKKCMADEPFRGLVEKELAVIDKIRKIIAFTKDYEEVGVLSPTWQDLGGVTRTAAAGLDQLGVTITTSGPDVSVYADPLLQKVFYNLFDNAVRHGGDRLSRVDVTWEVSGESLLVTVEDDGEGIDPEMRPHLFERGYGKNTGFGLYLSREILDITGISITEDGRPGSGSRFVITVPGNAWRPQDTGSGQS